MVGHNDIFITSARMNGDVSDIIGDVGAEDSGKSSINIEHNELGLTLAKLTPVCLIILEYNSL
jgi:hypothetical protein